MHTVLVVGGTGFFGNRIAAALAAAPNVDVLLGGRDPSRVQSAARALGLSSEHGVVLDVNAAGLATTLKRLRVSTVVHTAGPFQQQEYHVARAAIEAGCNYIDLADGRAFVTGIGGLDELARTHDVSVISGASTVPALSSAVVDRFVPEFARLDSIQSGLASGSRAPGLATTRGVFSYCGKPLSHWEKGSWVTAHGWHGLYRHEFPSPIGGRWISRCDIPDLDLFPRRYPSVHTVSFHAGFASTSGQWVVWILANLVRLRVLPSVAPFAAPLTRIARWMEPFGSDKGGMFVALKGLGRNGQPLCITWNLIARQNHGPFIPCGAAIALASKLARGVKLPAGATPCMGLLTLNEYLGPLTDLDIEHDAFYIDPESKNPSRLTREDSQN